MLDPKQWHMFIAIPLSQDVERDAVFTHPESFHIIDIDWDTAEKIGQSPFSWDAMETTNEYPIEPGEDPFFDADQVDALLSSLEKWRKSLLPGDKKSFEIVQDALLEAKARGVGIYFKF